MKPLLYTAVIALTVGVLTLLVAGFTWPQYDPADAYDKARIAAEYVGAEQPSPLEYLTAPANLYTGHIIAISAGGTLLTVGVFAGLLALHARAVRQAIFESAPLPAPVSNPYPNGTLGV